MNNLSCAQRFLYGCSINFNTVFAFWWKTKNLKKKSQPIIMSEISDENGVPQ